jgi:hypothetical protein
VTVLVWFLGVTLAGLAPVDSAEPAEPVDYTTQIKPILVDKCDSCHGVDDQQSGLRLDTARIAIKGGDRGPAVIPGKSDESLLYQVLIGEGDVTAMPAEGPPLNEEQIALIKRWIDQGAAAPDNETAGEVTIQTDHWAFQPIRRPTFPQVKATSWARNPIDLFVRARLEQEELAASSEADRITLIRRLSFDLHGLPPTLEEIESYLLDDLPGAYERVVDRMLASPHYGERWGRHWLDVARYADSNGFTIDSARSIWKYRDWVIDAWNRDLTFDQFSIEQLAGDLLPSATIAQKMATGFHRNTLVNEEGGTDDEQFRVESIVDRVNTTGSVFLGLTVGCAQCHAHKYDPITQREYYELFAIFNNCDEPNIRVPLPEQAAALEILTAELKQVKEELDAYDAESLKGLPDWEAMLATSSAGIWETSVPVDQQTEKGSVLTVRDDRSVYVDFSIPPNDVFTLVVETDLARLTGLRLEALTHPDLPNMGPGRSSDGNFVLSEVELFVAGLQEIATGPPAMRPVSLSEAVADYSQTGYPVSHAIDGNQETGWSIGVSGGNMNVNREAVFLFTEPIRSAAGLRLTVKLHQNHAQEGYLLGRFRLSLSSAPAEALRIPETIRKILAKSLEERSKEEQSQLALAFLQTDSDRRPFASNYDRLKRREEQLVKAIPTTMVLRERDEPRQSHIHVRGDFLRKGAVVSGNVPAVLSRLPEEIDQPSRLDLARWLVNPDQPLTARVTVNRFWQRFFGTGLVETENDFGTQGALPSHPHLLDWLADEFMRIGWSMKGLHRLIVTSATYRQSSAMREELLTRDPRNRFLARQSRLRLEAETIRDVALAATGMLSTKMFGPGVYPPQPEGIYVLTQKKKSWPEDQGEDRYRRGMYTFFWRSSPYPFLPTFDAPAANTACTRRSRSNTPLQALTMANDRVFLELARGLSARVLREGPDDRDGRIRLAFRLCLAREPSALEQKRLAEYLDGQRESFAAAGEAALGDMPPVEGPSGISPAEATAWMALARVLLNLDEFITRE